MARTTTPPRFYAMSQLAFLDRDVSQFGWSAVSPSRPALSHSAARTGRQAKRTAARSHAQPPLCGEHGEHGEHWTLMAGARGAKLDQAGCVRTSASASRPLYGAREAEAGGPSKSVTATPSISVILLSQASQPSGQPGGRGPPRHAAGRRRHWRGAAGASGERRVRVIIARPPERREVPAEVQFEVARNTVTDTVPSPKLLCRAATELCAIRRSLSQKEPRARCQAATVRR